MSNNVTTHRLATIVRHLTFAQSTLEFEAPPADAKYATMPPNQCYFPSSQFIKVPLISIKQATHNSSILQFALPPNTSLNLTVSSCIMMQATHKDQAKPYNPISSNETLGSFSILVKHYNGGSVSTFAKALNVGEKVGFCQFPGNIKPFRFPFRGTEKITMLCVGTGITPHYQALIALMRNTTANTPEVRLLYGNASVDDIMLFHELKELAAGSNGKLRCTFVVGTDATTTKDPPTRHNESSIETGWVDKEKVARLGFSPEETNSIVWVCGTPLFYETMAGSRHSALTSECVLSALGYQENQVWRS